MLSHLSLVRSRIWSTDPDAAERVPLGRRSSGRQREARDAGPARARDDGGRRVRQGDPGGDGTDAERRTLVRGLVVAEPVGGPEHERVGSERAQRDRCAFDCGRAPSTE